MIQLHLKAKMKIFYLTYLLSAIFSFTSISCYAMNSTLSQTQIKLKNLNQEIESLHNELVKMRKDSLNNEMHAQPYMFDNWHEFTESIKLSEESEKNILKIKKQIKDLTQERDSLYDPQNSPNKLLK
jgi:hypothetical protein